MSELLILAIYNKTWGYFKLTSTIAVDGFST